MLTGSGFTVIDLDTDVSGEAIAEMVREHTLNIVALSALLTTTMAPQGEVIKALETAGLRSSFNIMVSKAPVTQRFCDYIGADAYTPYTAAVQKQQERLYKTR